MMDSPSPESDHDQDHGHGDRHPLSSSPPPLDEMETLCLSDSTSFHPLSLSPTTNGDSTPLSPTVNGDFGGSTPLSSTVSGGESNGNRDHHPLLSPLSPYNNLSSSFLDPPSYAEAIFIPSSPSSSVPSALYSQITVGKPQKELDTSNPLVSTSYVTYGITAKTGGTEFTTRRRFRDVVTLADRLSESYRGFFVPSRPDKSVVERQVMSQQEFVEQRRSAIEKYLKRLAMHPLIGRSDELGVFLQTKGRSPLVASVDVVSRVVEGAGMLPGQLLSGGGENGSGRVEEVVQPARGGRDLLRMFRELKQSVVNDWGGVRPAIVEEDKEFLEKKEKIQDLEQQLTIASQQAGALLKAKKDIGHTMGDLGLAFIKLTKFETEEAVHNSQKIRADDTRCFGTAAVKACRFYRESNAQVEKHLDTFREYLGLMMPVHTAFSDRTSALLTVQALLSDLSSLQAKADKLESASSKIFGVDKSRIQKIEELKETIRTTEDAKNVAIREYERIKENIRNELERFDKERHRDFFGMMKAFVTIKVEYAEKITSVWEKVAEDTSRYAKKSG